MITEFIGHRAGFQPTEFSSDRIFNSQEPPMTRTGCPPPGRSVFAAIFSVAIEPACASKRSFIVQTPAESPAAERQ
jgi:hypothetical protein